MVLFPLEGVNAPSFLEFKMSDVIDDGKISKKPIPDLKRQSYYDDGEKTYVRVVNNDQNENDPTFEERVSSTLENILDEIKKTNLYLAEFLGDEMELD